MQFKKNEPQKETGELSDDSKRLAVFSLISYSARKSLKDYFNGSTSHERINDEIKKLSSEYPGLNIGDYESINSN